MDLLQAVTFMMVAAAGWAVVITRDPLPQSLVAGFFGLMLTILFVVLQAPDVALSEMAVGAVAFPLMVLLTVAKTRSKGAL
jgi:energy-converting hydrogenase B subunit D